MCMRINCPRPPAVGLSAVVDVSAAVGRTNPRFFTQIYAEKIRRLVRRGGFFGLGIKFFAAACRRQGLASLSDLPFLMN